jgi:hypothetical protein
MDQDGVNSGRYTQAATWGGWITTLRIDGWRQVDFSILSAREIVPPCGGPIEAGHAFNYQADEGNGRD